MNLLPNIGNSHILQLKEMDILISYETPVACKISGQGCFKTATAWSRTTSKHINYFLDGRPSVVKPQEYFDSLLDQLS